MLLFSPTYSENLLLESPDLDLDYLELVTPPKIMGYPWTKWVCEQIALKCSELAGIPLTISKKSLKTKEEKIREEKKRKEHQKFSVSLGPSGLRNRS